MAAEIDAQVAFANAPAVSVAHAAPVANVFHAERVFSGITNAIASLASLITVAAVRL